MGRDTAHALAAQGWRVAVASRDLANAGKILGAGPLDALSPEEFAATVALNMGGVFNALSAVVPVLKRAGGGARARRTAAAYRSWR